MKITLSKIKELENSYSGICMACGATRYGMTEPDAENYHCDQCEENAVLGPHWLVFSDEVEIVE